MIGYTVQRIGVAILIVLLATTALFVMIQFVPGDPANVMLGPRATPELRCGAWSKHYICRITWNKLNHNKQCCRCEKNNKDRNTNSLNCITNHTLVTFSIISLLKSTPRDFFIPCSTKYFFIIFEGFQFTV